MGYEDTHWFPSLKSQNVSAHGLWLLSGEKELFMSWEDFPWFKNAPIGELLNVEEPAPGHFYWPDLDVDIGLENI